MLVVQGILRDDITASGLFVGGVGVTKSHSRLYVSNDNPYSESQFKTLGSDKEIWLKKF
jgi:hypothetical protein